MPAQLPQYFRHPNPILQHNAWNLDEISSYMCTVKSRVGRMRDNIVNTMTKFVEESSHFVMAEQSRSGYGRFSEIADKSQ